MLNSKSDYNRCALPRLSAKLGEVTLASLEKEKKAEKEEEEALRKKIRELRKKMGEKRRESPSMQDQPAAKRRKVKEGYKRVIQEQKKQEKRPIQESGEANKTEVYDIFKKRRKKEFQEYLEEKEEEIKGNQVTYRKSEEELRKEWEEKLQEREKLMAEEDELREKRIHKAKRMQQSYELMRLCRKTLEMEGITWAKSKERREMERSKILRLSEGKAKKKIQVEKKEKETIQRKITENLAILPKNRQILLQREEERERRILLQETKKELWKRWRQRKGRGMRDQTRDDKENLEDKLKKIEAEVAKYKEELERKEQELRERNTRLKKKEEKERHWAMLRWVASFIEENQENWEKRRREEAAEREQERKREE